MSLNSKIEWTHHTANLWWGCTNVNPGCDNCYAEKWANRYGVKWGNDAPRKEIKGVWGNLLGMQAKAAAAGEIHRVFVGSMMDIFEKPMPVVNASGDLVPYQTDALRTRFFEEIVPNSPNLLFLLLTKRPSNINKIIPLNWLYEPPSNVMFGASIVDNVSAKHVTRHLKHVKGKKFISVEPQLEFINFSNDGILQDISWVIQGGESGPNKRPFDTVWARHTKDVCFKNNVSYFFKQVDKVQDIPNDLLVREFPSIVQ
jgi:protein gp37